MKQTHAARCRVHPSVVGALVAVMAALGGCAGHSDLTKAARSALDAGKPRQAIALYNEQLGVESEKQPLSHIEDDQVLFVLDRATVLQWVDAYALSSRDLEAADKQIEVLDFSRGAMDDIGKYLFSDDTGPYKAPAYEKLMINTLNMVNYLTRGDLNGARIEARRLAVMQKFVDEHESHGKSLSAPGSYLAGFTFEKSNRPGEALRYYDEALQVGKFDSLADPVRRLAALDPYRSPRLTELIESKTTDSAATEPDETAEVLVVVSYGRVPAKISKRIPIGLALTYASGFISHHDRGRANRLAAQGLVTWINYPTLGKPRGKYSVPRFRVDGRSIDLEGMLAVDVEAIKIWRETQGAVVTSAITRMIARIIAGETARQVSGGGLLGTLLSLGTQATLTATDTPDTRSWSTLPARIAFGRVRLPPGKHVIELTVSGVRKRQEIDIPKGGWAVVNLTVLK